MSGPNGDVTVTDTARQADLIRRAQQASRPAGADEFGRRLSAEADRQRSRRSAADGAVDGGALPGPAAPPMADDVFGARLRAALAGAETSEGPASAEPTEIAPEAGREPGPVGAGGHVVSQGECVASIAAAHGHFWETLWDDPANGELRSVRRDPNVLLPGDRVHVPALREKFESGATELRHRFRRKGQPEVLRLRILNDDEPRANEPFTLVVDGATFEGVTDAAGQIVQPIPPRARRAQLRVGRDEVEEFVFELGEVDPIDELSGVQGRLGNLGFDCWGRDGQWSAETEDALRRFQRRHGLVESGRPDAATRAKLQEAYGC